MEHLTREELLRLLAEARQHRERDWVMILVAYWHGLRASEVTHLTDANFAGGFLTVQRLKGSKKTTQPLMENADQLLNERAAVEAWLAKSGEGLLFPISRKQFWRLFQLYCRRAEIPPHRAHPHVLKHSIAMQMIKEAGIHEVKQYLGHRSLDSTGAYLQVDDEQASAALAKAEKRAQQTAEVADRSLDSLGGVGIEETLRRVLRSLEQAKSPKGKRKKGS